MQYTHIMGFWDDLKNSIEDFGRAVDKHERDIGGGAHTGNGANSRTWGQWVRSEGPYLTVAVAMGSIMLGVLIWVLRMVLS